MNEHSKWYEKIITDKSRINFAFQTVTEGQYIGNLGLRNIDWRNRRGELWIYMDKEFWDKGFGREAISIFINYVFGTLNLHKVYLKVGMYNSRAIHLYESLGFLKEGTLREEVYFDGSYYDVYRMAALNKDWEKI